MNTLSLRLLEHANALVAEDAYREFGNAPYDVVALVADRLPYAAMRRWIVDPRIPGAWIGYAAARRFRGATYRIRVRNPRGAGKRVTSASLDGRPLGLDPALGYVALPVLPAGTVHEAEIELG